MVITLFASRAFSSTAPRISISLPLTVGYGHLLPREADTIPTDDRDRVRVLGIGLGIELVVGLVLVKLLQSSFV